MPPLESRAHAHLEMLGHGRLLRHPTLTAPCPPGSGKNDSAEKVAGEARGAIGAGEASSPRTWPSAREEEQ